MVVPVRPWPTITIGGVTVTAPDLGMVVSPREHSEPVREEETISPATIVRPSSLRRASSRKTDHESERDLHASHPVAEVVEAGRVGRPFGESVCVELDHRLRTGPGSGSQGRRARTRNCLPRTRQASGTLEVAAYEPQ